jgi:hypothetical protein
LLELWRAAAHCTRVLDSAARRDALALPNTSRLRRLHTLTLTEHRQILQKKENSNKSLIYGENGVPHMGKMSLAFGNTKKRSSAARACRSWRAATTTPVSVHDCTARDDFRCHAPAADCVPCTTLTLTDSTEQPQQQSAVGAEALLDTLLLAGLARRALARV